MKPILIDNNQDCTVSVQMVTPECDGKKLPQEIALLIENERGDHLATFTPQQALTLIIVLERAAAELLEKSTGKQLRTPKKPPES